MPSAAIRSRLTPEVHMNPYSEPTPEQLLEHQKSMTFPGAVVYERGLAVEVTSGFIAVTDKFVVIFGDNGTLVRDQKRIMVPMHRVYEVRGDE
jgi:hypothetical protein